nr:hypothetical protein [Tanacetum cinerariifolium]
MAKQCTKPKRKLNAEWFKDKNFTLPAIQDDLILSVIEQLKTQVVNCTKLNQDNKQVNELLTAEVERYRNHERVLKEQINDNQESTSYEQSLEIETLKHTLSEHLKEKESLTQKITLLKNDFQKEESRNIDRELALEKQETLMLAKESRSKMIEKQKDPQMIEKKVITKPINYAVRKLAAENDHLKQTYKKLYDSIKSSRVRSKEQCDDLINKVNLKSAEVSDLNARLQEKVLVITALKVQLDKLKGKAVLTEAISLNPIDPELLKVDVAPLVPKLCKNRTAHTDYIRHTLEEAATLREIVERVNLVSSASGSLSQDNKKNNRIRRTQKKAKKNKVEDHLRTVKSSLNKESVVDTKATSSVLNSVLNVNSDLKCTS